MTDDEMLAAFAVEHEAAADHHIGRIGDVVLAVQLLAGANRRRLRAEGEQAQLFLREAFEQAHGRKGADIVIQRHNVPEPSGQSLSVPWSRSRIMQSGGPAPSRAS